MKKLWKKIQWRFGIFSKGEARNYHCKVCGWRDGYVGKDIEFKPELKGTKLIKKVWICYTCHVYGWDMEAQQPAWDGGGLYS